MLVSEPLAVTHSRQTWADLQESTYVEDREENPFRIYRQWGLLEQCRCNPAPGILIPCSTLSALNHEFCVVHMILSLRGRIPLDALKLA